MREIARSCNISHSTVSEALRRAGQAGLTWPLPDELGDEGLEALLYPKPPQGVVRPEPDMEYVHRELRRKDVHVSLQLLWQEYKESNPNGLQYSQFCHRYRLWQGSVDICMRQAHRAGEKLFVDFAGDKVPVVDRNTGEVQEASVFVATLGASSYSYARACWVQDLPNWIELHCLAFEFFGGVTDILVPDNTKTAVKDPCYYEPDLNRSYEEMARYYGTVVIPARVRKPQDKGKVESGVLQVERWVLAALRNRTFYALHELNEAIAEHMVKLNDKPFQKMEGSRRIVYETIDRPALKPLPPQRYEFSVWKKVRANIDYHVEVDKRYYSVPYQLRGRDLEARFTKNVVEVFFEGKRVASHPRCVGQQRSRTEPAHMPSTHRAHAEWTPSRLINWGKSIGEYTGQLVEAILSSKHHPEQGYRSCLGLIRLAERYSTERVEAACRRALGMKATSYRSIKCMLEKGFDRLPLPEVDERPPLQHDNIRGSSYYTGEGSTC